MLFDDYTVWALDIEVSKPTSAGDGNVACGFMNASTGAVRQFHNVPGLDEGEPLDRMGAFYAGMIADDAMLLSYNGAAYDLHLLRAILQQGITDGDILYEMSRNVIAINSGAFTKSAVPTIFGERHCDLYQVTGGRAGSLKEIAAKLGMPQIEELPYAWDAVLTVEQWRHVLAYNRLDLKATVACGAVLNDAILARLALSDQFQVDVLNCADAKLAETVMKKRLFGSDRALYPEERSWMLSGIMVASKFTFQRPELQALQQRMSKWNLRFDLLETRRGDGTVEKSIESGGFSEVIKLDGTDYTIGVGGLHSVDLPGLWHADDKFAIVDVDVQSFYPSIILNHALCPAHLRHTGFLAEYRKLRDRRLQAKQDGHKALSDGLKIAVNALYGKCNSPYSWLLHPPTLIATTLIGQLSLLALIEKVLTVDGAMILSANTDGACIRVPHEHV